MSEVIQATVVQPGDAFLRELDVAIDFHEKNADDHYGTGLPVLISLHEVRNAYARSHGFPERKGPRS